MKQGNKTRITPHKRYNVKPKPIHYRAVQKLIENGGNKTKALLDAGYSVASAQNQKVLKTQGFIDALNASGLDIETLNIALASDIKAKPKQRLGELTLAYKLHGKLRENVTENKTLVLITSGESAKRYSIETNEHTTSSVDAISSKDDIA